MSREFNAPDKIGTSLIAPKPKGRVPGQPADGLIRKASSSTVARKQSVIRTSPKKAGDIGVSPELKKEDHSSSEEEDQAEVVEEDPAVVVERAQAREQERKERHERERLRLEADVEDILCSSVACWRHFPAFRIRIDDGLSRRGRPWLEDSSDSSDDGRGALEDTFAAMDDPFMSQLDLDNDSYASRHLRPSNS
eukprot:3480736-Rhodomonas_salina.5